MSLDTYTKITPYAGIILGSTILPFINPYVSFFIVYSLGSDIIPRLLATFSIAVIAAVTAVFAATIIVPTAQEIVKDVQNFQER